MPVSVPFPGPALAATGASPANASSIPSETSGSRPDIETPISIRFINSYILTQSAFLASLCHSIPLPVRQQRCELFGRNPNPSIGRLGQCLDQVSECDDAHTSQAVLTFDLLHRGQAALAPLLAIQGQRHGGRLRAGMADHFQRFAYRRARRYHIVHDQDPAAQRAADDGAALAVV